MRWKRIISICAATSVVLVSFHVAAEHAGAEPHGSRLGTDANLTHSHGAGDPANERDPDHPNFADHDHFGTFLRPSNTYASDLFPVFLAAYSPAPELRPTGGFFLPESLPQLYAPGPALFLRNRSLRL